MQEQLALSRKDVADATGLSLRMIDYLLASGELHGRRIGRRILVSNDELQRFLRHDHPTAPRAKRDDSKS